MKHKTLIENTFPLPLLLRNETSKPLPIAIATLLQREGVLTFRNCRKYREIGFWKPLLVANFAENDPQMASKACLKDGKWTPRSPGPLAITFHGVWGTLLGKPSWNEPKTLKPYFSVWPNAMGRGFDVSPLIWNDVLLCSGRRWVNGPLKKQSLIQNKGLKRSSI